MILSGRGIGAKLRYRIKKHAAQPVSEQLTQQISSEYAIHQDVARLLQQRGISGMTEAAEFLEPDIKKLHDPFLFADMHECVSMIKNMVATHGKITVFGDYDADGVCACAILYGALRKMGADVCCHLPSRLEHGYGLSLEAVDSLKGTNLLITVDCGITNVQEIALAKKYGMKVIVTDHHMCPAILPKADFILNAKRDGEPYPFGDLCGAGVAFKLVCALLGEEAHEYIDLAAFATIADIVPLMGENRIIAAAGLKKMNETPNPGILALYKKTGVKKQEIDSQTVAFLLAPRLNAPGRLESATLSLELLLTGDEDKRQALAEQLCALNSERQQRQESIFSEAVEMGAADMPRMVVLYKEEWDVGIVGLAAGKLSEALCRPTLLLGGVGDGMFTGSARSIDGIDIYDALLKQGELMEKFGGHMGAAGLTIKEENIGVLKARLDAYISETYPAEFFTPVRYYDMQKAPGQIDPAFIKDIGRLQPFGHSNRRPEILIKNARLQNAKAIGDGRHVRFNAAAGGGQIGAVAFRQDLGTLPKAADIIGTASINDYDGKPQMIVETLSFDESLSMQYERHMKVVRRADRPGAEEAEIYFCDREALLHMYFALKELYKKGGMFRDMQQFLVEVTRASGEKRVAKIAFMLAVLVDTRLLEIQNNGKMHIVVHSRKVDLCDSAVFVKYSSVL